MKAAPLSKKKEKSLCLLIVHSTRQRRYFYRRPGIRRLYKPYKHNNSR